MKRKRLLGLAVVALALAGLVSLAAYRLARGNHGSTAPVTTPVVAAAAALPVGVQLRDTDLKLLRLPPGALPQHVYSSPSQLVGKVLTSAAVPNQVLVNEMVAAPGTGVGLPPLIPAGMRAVSVKVNDVVSVAGFAIPGTHVDVLLTGNPRQDNDPSAVTTITLLSNVQVLTAGQQMEQSPNGKPEKVTVITLLVDPAGAEKLALADGFGHIQLALRNPLDHLAAATAPLLNGTLYGQRAERSSAPSGHRGGVTHAAAPPAPAVWAVDLISGDKKEILKFPAGPEPQQMARSQANSGEHQLP